MKRVAAIVTEYRPRSHADVIVGKLLAGYDLDGVWTTPRVQVVSMYTDQVPANDTSRDVAKRFDVPIFSTVKDTLTIGGGDLAVDGVVLIGEHGNYPRNELGQTLYPRRRLFEEIVAVMRRSGRVVPVFSDKHLSYSWDDARWMYDAAREMRIPLLAGSSLPLTWRRPPLEIPMGADITHALGIGYGDLDAYGFHSLEMVQCMVERRRGGETGVAAVQCLEGPEFWKARADRRWPPDLFEAACQRLSKPIRESLRTSCTSPAAFLVEYVDGIQATVLMLDGAVSEFTVASRFDGTVGSTQFYLQSVEPFGHFAFLANQIEELILTGRASYPVERTLLTTGILARALESRHLGGIRLETPELHIAYTTDAV
jgi:hypothetical protein